MGAFFCKKHLPIVWRPEISFFGTPKFHILGAGGLFSDLFDFAKFTESLRNLLSSLGICSLILLYIFIIGAGSGTIKGGASVITNEENIYQFASQ